jgi:hypothetical protein
MDLTRITVRAKVTNASSGSTLATLRCYATRRGTNSPTEVGTAVPIIPSSFSSGGVWKELELFCNYLPDDVSQSIEVAGFAVGLTDLSIDYARIERSSNASSLDGLKLQDVLWGIQHATAVGACRALDSNQGCCGRAVLARNNNVACSTLCAGMGWVCKSEVAVVAFAGQRSHGGWVGSYFNYGCGDTSINPRSEPQRPSSFKAGTDDSHYHTYCCCGPN